MACKPLSVHLAHTIVHVTSLWRVTHFCRVAREDADWWLKIVTRSNVLTQFFSEWRIHYYRPQRSWGKVMFLQASVILLLGGRYYPSMHCRWYPSIPCSRSPVGCAIPACIAGSIPACLAAGGSTWSGWCLVPGGVAFCYGLLLWSSVMPFFYGLLVWWPSD